MYSEKLPESEMAAAEKIRYQSLLKELIHCEAQEAKWGKLARDAKRNILSEHAHHIGEHATLIRHNGMRISVVLCQSGLTPPGVQGCGEIKYRFQWPYKDSNRFREAVVREGDRIEWAGI